MKESAHQLGSATNQLKLKAENPKLLDRDTNQLHQANPDRKIRLTDILDASGIVESASELHKCRS